MVGDTYTSQFGGTPIGTQTQNFQDILKSITGGVHTMSPQQAQSGYQNALSQQLAMNVNQPQFMQQAQTQMTQQAGIPGLQASQEDLGKMFQMYLADSGLAGKYASTANTNPYAGQLATTAGTTGAPNPYLSSPEALAASATPTGAGFTVPGLVTSAMSTPASGVANLMNLINTAIGTEKGIVTSKMGDVSANYQKSLDTLGVLANVFKDAYDKAQAKADTSLSADMLASLFGTSDGSTPTPTPTEPKPTIIPGTVTPAKKGVQYQSPEGQWIYDWQSSDWVPVID